MTYLLERKSRNHEKLHDFNLYQVTEMQVFALKPKSSTKTFNYYYI
jgi:hypothetical protein